jgi:hypothetical protein
MLLDPINNSKVFIYIIVGYCWILAVGNFTATLGPVCVLDQVLNPNSPFSVPSIRKAFVMYSQEAAKELGCHSEVVLYSMAMNILIFVPAFVVGVFVLRWKLWARNALIFIIALYFMDKLGISLLSSEPDYISVVLHTMILLGMVYFLTRESTKELFEANGRKGSRG